MKKILFFTPYYYPNIVGGAEVSTQLIAESIPKCSMIVTVGEVAEEKIINHVKVKVVTSGFMKKAWKSVLDNEKLNILDKIKLAFFANKGQSKLISEYINIIKKNNIGLVIVNSNIDVLGRASVWKAASLTSTPLMLVLRDPILLNKKVMGVNLGPIYRKMIKRQLKYVTCIAAPSQYMIDLYKHYGIRKDKSYVIPNAVDIPFERNKKKKKIILYAGSIRKEKGILTLIKAVELLYKNNREIILEMYGNGDLINECKPYEFIKIYSWINNHELYKKMRESMITVLPSEYPEAFGRIVIESISQGTLAIGSNAGGIPETMKGLEKYIFNAGDYKKLSSIIDNVFSYSESEYEREISYAQEVFNKYKMDVYKKNWHNCIKREVMNGES